MKLMYFSPEEFEACVPSCHIGQMDAAFLQKLDAARHIAGVAFRLNSCYRSPEWDKSKHRSGRGYHTLGRAADVACADSRSRYRIIQGCIEVGLSCGISKTFVHIDDRPSPCIFLY